MHSSGTKRQRGQPLRLVTMSTSAVSLPGSSRGQSPGCEPAPLPGPRGGSRVVSGPVPPGPAPFRALHK